jgi:Fe-S cluster assembly protein SufD
MQTLKDFKENIPNRKSESYKYTNFTKAFEPFESFDFKQKDFDLSSLKVDGAINLFVTGGVLDEASDKSPLVHTAKAQEEVKAVNSKAFADDYIFNLGALNTIEHSFELKDKVIVEKPIFIFHVVSNDDTHLFHQKSTYKIGKGCDLKILEVFVNTDENKVFFNHSSLVDLGENSNFLHVHHQRFNSKSVFGLNIAAQVAKNSHYKSFTTTLGSMMSRANIHIDINGEGSNATASGVYTLQGSQHSDINSYISHNSPHSESHQLYKGIMNDTSRGVFTGLIKVQRDAQLVNSVQMNRNLLLTKGAHANSRPQLEIFADDVKCAHGSTTGQLSEAELFYFLSRGITEEKAKMMLARAFTYDVLLKIDNILVREYLHDDITEKFENNVFGSLDV